MVHGINSPTIKVVQKDILFLCILSNRIIMVREQNAINRNSNAENSRRVINSTVYPDILNTQVNMEKDANIIISVDVFASDASMLFLMRVNPLKKRLIIPGKAPTLS